MKFNILIKKIESKLDPEEEIQFKAWFWKSSLHREFFEKVKQNYNKDLDQVDTKKGWEDFCIKLESRKKKKYFNKWKVAAAILILISASFLLNKFHTPETGQFIIANHEVIPGSPKAILTNENGDSTYLAEGKEIKNAVMTSEGISIIYKRSSAGTEHNPVINYLTIPRGGEFHLELSDGTQVWLNSESKLKYPVQFSENKPRVVELLYGEAFFDVTHSSENSGSVFQVVTKNQEITVLGTEFNIQAYKKENILTTLVKGKVTVNTGRNIVELEPGLQSIVSNDTLSEDIHVREVKVNDVISWKNGFFSFNKMKLDEIMITLSRWYDLKIIYEDEQKKNLVFSGELKRSQSINTLLMYLGKTGDIKFRIDGKNLYIK